MKKISTEALDHLTIIHRMDVLKIIVTAEQVRDAIGVIEELEGLDKNDTIKMIELMRVYYSKLDLSRKSSPITVND